MKLSKTTLAGSTAAVALTVTALTGNTTHTHLAGELVAAIAVAFLGRHAADCPANCPGTDERRRPRPWQRDLFTAAALVAITAALVLVCSGCTSPNPQAGPSHPGAPAYIVNPALAQTSNTVAALSQTAAEVTGTGPLIPTATNGILAAIGALSILWARHKSQVAATMADGLAAAGPDAVAPVVAATRPRSKGLAVRETIVAAQRRQLDGLQPPPSTPPKS